MEKFIVMSEAFLIAIVSDVKKKYTYYNWTKMKKNIHDHLLSQICLVSGRIVHIKYSVW